MPMEYHTLILIFNLIKLYSFKLTIIIDYNIHSNLL